jgi:hypothetical protein
LILERCNGGRIASTLPHRKDANLGAFRNQKKSDMLLLSRNQAQDFFRSLPSSESRD